MTSEPYASARRVFWIVDNGSSHAGKTSIARLQDSWANARLIHLPIHASWLNQIELFFSIVQRKALTPNDLGSLEELAERLIAFGERYRAIAEPFEWTFTRSDLERVLDRVEAPAAPTEPGGAHLRLAA
jgi:DDE superfamily endonuclease